MTTVQTLHPVPTPSNIRTDLDSPTTPRIHHSINHHHHHHPHHIQHQSLKKEEDAGRTPTMSSFAEANGKRALPLSPPPAAHATIAKQLSEATSEDGKRPVSQRSNRSLDSNELHETEHSHTSPDNDGSDGESVDGDTGRPTKKKKGQRFFCTDYPPCNLSFTRSEHLARHIRKHTGERPFQCHCNRRFSRLDNLRQHAQTVHVNEEIPTDSLAATGTRFQRQIRTDRVRPAGARARASTTSSATSHGRGHSRNLSTSSITSIASTASNVSTLSSISQDHRFHPLVMAPEQRPPPSLSIDTHRGSSQYGYAPSASGGPTTPTSTSYPAQPASPYSTMASPVASSRFPSYEGSSRHARRLSVPNGHSPYHQGYTQAPASPSGQSYIMSNGASTVQSPTSSVFSNRQEMTATEADIRRRTWHPSTYSGYNYQRPATSGLSYSQTPDAPQPSVAPQATAAAAGQTVTLPGFKDLVNTITTGRPSTPPAQVSGHQPPAMESPSRPLTMTGTPSERGTVKSGPLDRPAHRSWDVSLHQNLNRLDIASGTPPRDMGWGQQTISDINQAAASVHGSPQHLHPPTQAHQPVHPGGHHQQQQQQSPLLGPPIHTSQASALQPMDVEPSSPSRDRRQGWYQGPIAPASQISVAQHQRISPASSVSEGVPTPNNPSFEHHPSIMHASGYVEGPRPQQHHQQQGYSNPGYPVTPASKASDPAQPQLSGLDALVAAATSESHNRDARR